MTHLRGLVCVVLVTAALGCSRSESSLVDRRPVEAAAAPAAPIDARPASARPRIVFLGDSLTAGYGLERSESVPSLIQTRLDSKGYSYEVVNAGVSGDTSA